MKIHIDYDRNVFLNCPFDTHYDSFFNAILFTVHRCGFILRCSKEYEDSSSIRIQNIVKLINESKYSIHDLSRVTLDETEELPRFNMPLELGICIGAINFGTKKQKENKILIIESQRFRYQKFISDIAGQDIRSHNNNIQDTIKVVRNFLSTQNSNITIPSASKIQVDFIEFLNDLPEIANENQWVVEELTFNEYSTLVSSWLSLKNIN